MKYFKIKSASDLDFPYHEKLWKLLSGHVHFGDELFPGAGLQHLWHK